MTIGADYDLERVAYNSHARSPLHDGFDDVANRQQDDDGYTMMPLRAVVDDWQQVMSLLEIAVG